MRPRARDGSEDAGSKDPAHTTGCAGSKDPAYTTARAGSKDPAYMTGCSPGSSDPGVTAGDEVLDPGTVADLRHAQDQLGNPEFINQLVELFRAGAPAKIERIREAVAARDGAALERVAHTLKTNCAVLGAAGMAGDCARLEAAAGRGDFAAAAAALDDTERRLPGVLRAVSALATPVPGV
jgi:HPt (histidine-containing phosphotransfer) domain-containing protein